MVKKTVIGVIPLWDDEKNSIWMIPGYLNLIRESGGIPITLPLKAEAEDIEQICTICDGFLLTGGQDVDPRIYGEVASDRCGAASEERDRLERYIFNYAVKNDTPLFGICRGIQFINAICGGTLYQDLPTEYRAEGEAQQVCHQMTPPYDQRWHRVDILPDTPLSKILNQTSLMVNSYHHQAIKRLAPTLSAMALSEDGLIEAVYMPDKRFIQAVQWHPELNFHCEESSREIFREFIREANPI